MVCKRWLSLLSPLNDFIGRFNHHHLLKRQLLLGCTTNSSNTIKKDDDSHSSLLPYTLLFRRGTTTPCFRRAYNNARLPYHPIYSFFSGKSKILHHGESSSSSLSLSSSSSSALSTTYLDFVKFPTIKFASWRDNSPNNKLIRSTFLDLLLVQRTPKNYYICNPLTQQWVKLPQLPQAYYHTWKISGRSKDYFDFYRSGLVCDPSSCRDKPLGGSYFCNCSGTIK